MTALVQKAYTEYLQRKHNNTNNTIESKKHKRKSSDNSSTDSDAAEKEANIALEKEANKQLWLSILDGYVSPVTDADAVTAEGATTTNKSEPVLHITFTVQSDSDNIQQNTMLYTTNCDINWSQDATDFLFTTLLNRKPEFIVSVFDTQRVSKTNSNNTEGALKTSLIRRIKLQIPSDMMTTNGDFFHYMSTYTNGYQINFTQQASTTLRNDSTTHYKVNTFTFCLHTGVLLNTNTNLSFAKANGFPVLTTFDTRNNFIWGYDPLTNTVMRWRNRGLAVKPQYDFVKNCSIAESVALTSQLAQELTPKSVTNTNTNDRQSALLISLLAKLSDRFNYNYSLHSIPAENNLHNELKVVCKGNNSSGAEGILSVTIRGKNINLGGEADQSDGYFVLTLSTHTFEVLKVRNFDNTAETANVHRMTDYIDDLPVNDGEYCFCLIYDFFICLLNTSCSTLVLTFFHY